MHLGVCLAFDEEHERAIVFLCIWRCVEHVMKKHQMARSGCMQKVAFECELVDGDIYSLFSIHRCFDDSFLYLCLVLNYRMLVC